MKVLERTVVPVVVYWWHFDRFGNYPERLTQPPRMRKQKQPENNNNNNNNDFNI